MSTNKVKKEVSLSHTNPLISNKILTSLHARDLRGIMTMREKLILYLTSEKGAVQLSFREEEYYERVQTTDQFIRKFGRDSIVAHRLREYYPKLTKALAQELIHDTKEILGSGMFLNKNYLLARHEQRLLDLYDLAIKQGKLDIAAKLLDSYTKALSLIPAKEEKKAPPPTAIVYLMNTIESQHPEEQEPMDIEDAILLSNEDP